MRHSLQRFARDPGRSAFIANNWSPAAGASVLTLLVSPTTNRSGAGDNNQSRLTSGSSIQSDIGVRKQFDRSYLFQALRQFFQGAFVDVFATHTCESDRRKRNVVPMNCGF